MLTEQPLGVPLTDIGEFVAEPGLWSTRAARRPPPAGAARAGSIGGSTAVSRVMQTT